MKTSNLRRQLPGQGAARDDPEEQSQASGKVKARYPHTPLGPSQEERRGGQDEAPGVHAVLRPQAPDRSLYLPASAPVAPVSLITPGDR